MIYYLNFKNIKIKIMKKILLAAGVAAMMVVGQSCSSGDATAKKAATEAVDASTTEAKSAGGGVSAELDAIEADLVATPKRGVRLVDQVKDWQKRKLDWEKTKQRLQKAYDEGSDRAKESMEKKLEYMNTAEAELKTEGEQLMKTAKLGNK